MNGITIERTRQLLGDRAKSLSDEEIQAKIDIMVVLANRCIDLIESRENKVVKHGHKD